MLQIPNTQSLSILKDPFEKGKIIRVSAYSHILFEGWHHSGTVEFANGKTKGEQKFEGETMGDVLNQMERFIKSLK